MISFACFAGRTLINFPPIRACLNSLRVPIVRIMRIAAEAFSSYFNLRGSAANTNHEVIPLSINSKAGTLFLEKNLQQSMNENAWKVMKLILLNRNTPNFQFSVFDYLVNFAKIAQWTTKPNQAELGRSLYMVKEDWLSTVLQSGQELTQDNSSEIMLRSATFIQEKGELNQRVFDFGDTRTEEVMLNNSVNEKRQHSITSLIQGTGETDTKIAFLSVSRFQSTWKSGFDEKQTERGDFINSNGKTIRIQMMSQTTKSCRFARQKDMDILELPFEGDSFSLLIFLPQLEQVTFDRKHYMVSKAQASLSILEKYFSENVPTNVLKNLNETLSQRKITIRLPRTVLKFDGNFFTALSQDEPVQIVSGLDLKNNVMKNMHQSLAVKEMRAESEIKLSEGGMGADFVQSSRSDKTPCVKGYEFSVDSPFAWVLVSKEKTEALTRKHNLSTIFFIGFVGELKPE